MCVCVYVYLFLKKWTLKYYNFLTISKLTTILYIIVNMTILLLSYY